jgi:hypothetical protein
MGHNKMLKRRRQKQRHKKRLIKAAKRAEKLKSNTAKAGSAAAPTPA